MGLKYRCNKVGCSTLIDYRGYCEVHKHLQPVRDFSKFNKPTGLYQTKEWKQLRKDFIESNPYCSYCGKKATEVHHKNTDERLFFNINNLTSVCKGCHDSLTQKNRNSKR